MADHRIPSAMLLAEVLRIHHWAGGDQESLARAYGLANGFESVINEELESFGISEETQSKVEDILEEIDEDEGLAGGMSLKSRLREADVEEPDAGIVMRLCYLQGRHVDAIDKIATSPDSIFPRVNQPELPELSWSGATVYMELIDCSGGAKNKMNAIFAPCVPRIGEAVTLEDGRTLRVVDVRYAMAPRETLGHSLTPHVFLDDEE